MPQFRKKPVVISAEQFSDDMDIADWPEGVMADCLGGEWTLPYIKTLEGAMQVRDGDWVITGVKGERYPCKPDIFAATYEPVNE